MLVDVHGHPISEMNFAADKVQTLKKMVIELAQQSQNLTKKDLQTWRKAWQTAIIVDNPRRRELYNVYTDVDIDSHLTGAIKQIRSVILKKTFKVMDRKTRKAKPELTELLESSWFKSIINHAIDSIFWGHSLVQFGNVISYGSIKKFDNVELVPREHVSPEMGVILRDPSDEFNKGISFREGRISDWVFEIGDPKSLGLFLKCAPHALPKKNMLSYWDQFGELFGMPIRIAKSSSTNTRELSRVERMLSEMGAAAWGLFPEGTDIEIKESARGDAYNVYDKRIERANSEMSKAILTVTMTMDDGSSKSQGEVHKEMLTAVIDAVADYIKDTANNLLPKLNRLGFPFTENDLFAWEESVDYTPEQQTAIEQMILNFFDVDENYFIEKYGIKITGKKAANTTGLQTLKKKN